MIFAGLCTLYPKVEGIARLNRHRACVNRRVTEMKSGILVRMEYCEKIRSWIGLILDSRCPHR